MWWEWGNVMNMNPEIVDLAIWKINTERSLQNKQK